MPQIADYDTYFDRFKVLASFWRTIEDRQLNEGDVTSIAYMLLDINSLFSAEDASDNITTLQSDIARLSTGYDTFKRRILTYVDNIISEIGAELEVANLQDTSFILERFTQAMEADGISVPERIPIIDPDDDPGSNLFILPSAVPKVNLGTGGLIYTFDQPRWQLMSFLSKFEDMTCECVSTATRTAERFQVSGSQDGAIIDAKHLGSGSGQIITAAGGSMFSNWIFNDWTSNLPDSWTLEAGTAGTSIQEDSDPYRGDGNLIFGSPYDGIISQKLPTSLIANSVYSIVFAVKRGASLTGKIEFSIADEDGVKEQVYLDSGSNPVFNVSSISTGSYDILFYTFMTKGTVNRNWRLVIDGSDLAGDILKFDAIQLIPMTRVNDLYFGIYVGDVDFEVGDNFGYQDANRTGFGVTYTSQSYLHGWLQRVTGKQFPQSSTPSISELT